MNFTSTIIRDSMPLKVLDLKTLTEDINGQKKRVTRLTSLCQKADWINENGRFYAVDVVKEAVEAIQPSIRARQVLGEFDHPEDSKIHMDRCCHIVTKLWMEGKNVYATYEILEDMPCGRMLKALIDQNVNVSVSSRGVGEMSAIFREGREILEVAPGFRFITWDAVNEPSVLGTKLNMMESKRLISQKSAIEKQFLSEYKKQLTKTNLK